MQILYQIITTFINIRMELVTTSMNPNRVSVRARNVRECWPKNNSTPFLLIVRNLNTGTTTFGPVSPSPICFLLLLYLFLPPPHLIPPSSSLYSSLLFLLLLLPILPPPAGPSRLTSLTYPTNVTSLSHCHISPTAFSHLLSFSFLLFSYSSPPVLAFPLLFHIYSIPGTPPPLYLSLSHVKSNSLYIFTSPP